MTIPATEPRSRYLDGLWHRLHPATPLLRGGLALVAILFYLAANVRERLFGALFGVEQGTDPLDELGRYQLLGVAALAVLGALVVGVGLFWISWRASTFRIDGEAVTVRTGVLFRATRTARLDRIQGVTISRPLLARLVGAARIELDVAGQNANVRLEYLSNTAAEALRHDVLALAAGRRHGTAAPTEGAIEGPPDLDQTPVAQVSDLDGPRLLAVTPGRAVGSVLLSETTIVLLVALAVLVPSLTVFGMPGAAAVSAFPLLIATVTVAIRRIGRNLRYSIVATPDGVRIAAGVVSTSTEAVPPGRIHAVRIEQPLLWRLPGWWRVSVNRAGQSTQRREVDRSLAPVATTDEVLALLPHLMPDLEGDHALGTAGLVGRGGGEDFTPAPRRARWLRPVAWRRTGFRRTDGSVFLRGGLLRRELTIVPQARVQSVALAQGPLERRLDVATVALHVVSGPVRTRIGLVDRAQAEALFVELAVQGAQIRADDVSHRWAERPVPL